MKSKLINQFTDTPIVENGVVGAGSVAVNSMPLFSSLINRSNSIPKNPRIIKYSKSEPHNRMNKKRKKGLGLRESFYVLAEEIGVADEKNFDSSEVIAKLKSLEDKESVDYRDTSVFGLVDSNGGIVRVTVSSDQAEAFEQDIQQFLTDRDESQPAPEIAEILFNLRDRYTIVDVEWPQVEEDAEEGQEIMPSQEGEGAEGELPPVEGAEGMPGAEGDMPPDLGMGGGADTGGVESLLQQVIDMMKADADARKAEAQAREAEAKTRQASAARDQAIARVKQEEQFMDMDEFNKQEKEKEKEAKRLAQLAKWKHDMAKNEPRPAQDPQYDFLPGEEEEEEILSLPQKLKVQSPGKPNPIRGRVTPTDIAKYILSRK